jgi:hypothetical protein
MKCLNVLLTIDNNIIVFHIVTIRLFNVFILIIVISITYNKPVNEHIKLSLHIFFLYDFRLILDKYYY